MSSKQHMHVQELLQKQARLQALLEAPHTDDLLAFFRTHGVAAAASDAAVNKLLVEDGLLRGRTAAAVSRAAGSRRRRTRAVAV